MAQREDKTQLLDCCKVLSPSQTMGTLINVALSEKPTSVKTCVKPLLTQLKGKVDSYAVLQRYHGEIAVKTCQSLGHSFEPIKSSDIEEGQFVSLPPELASKPGMIRLMYAKLYMFWNENDESNRDVLWPIIVYDIPYANSLKFQSISVSGIDINANPESPHIFCVSSAPFQRLVQSNSIFCHQNDIIDGNYSFLQKENPEFCNKIREFGHSIDSETPPTPTTETLSKEISDPSSATLAHIQEEAKVAQQEALRLRLSLEKHQLLLKKQQEQNEKPKWVESLEIKMMQLEKENLELKTRFEKAPENSILPHQNLVSSSSRDFNIGSALNQIEWNNNKPLNDCFSTPEDNNHPDFLTQEESGFDNSFIGPLPPTDTIPPNVDNAPYGFSIEHCPVWNCNLYVHESGYKVYDYDRACEIAAESSSKLSIQQETDNSSQASRLNGSIPDDSIHNGVLSSPRNSNVIESSTSSTPNNNTKKKTFEIDHDKLTQQYLINELMKNKIDLDNLSEEEETELKKFKKYHRNGHLDTAHEHLFIQFRRSDYATKASIPKKEINSQIYSSVQTNILQRYNWDETYTTMARVPCNTVVEMLVSLSTMVPLTPDKIQDKARNCLTNIWKRKRRLAKEAEAEKVAGDGMDCESDEDDTKGGSSRRKRKRNLEDIVASKQGESVVMKDANGKSVFEGRFTLGHGDLSTCIVTGFGYGLKSGKIPEQRDFVLNWLPIPQKLSKLVEMKRPNMIQWPRDRVIVVEKSKKRRKSSTKSNAKQNKHNGHT